MKAHPRARAIGRGLLVVFGVTIPLLSAQHLIDDRNARRDANAAVVKATADIARDARRAALSAKRTSAKVCRSANKSSRELNAVLDYFTNGIEATSTDPATAQFLEAVPRPTIQPCPKG